MFVKFCGFTRINDVEAAVDAGVSAVGFVFHPDSPRNVSPEQARYLARPVKGTTVKAAGIFVKQGFEQIRRIADYVDLDYLQVYNHDFIPLLDGHRRLLVPYRIAEREDLQSASFPGRENFLLLDSVNLQHYGGTGEAFNWEYLREFPHLDRAIIAGGINKTSLPALLRSVKPGGIDLSSGIEESPGKKSAAKMKSIMKIMEEFNNDTAS